MFADAARVLAQAAVQALDSTPWWGWAVAAAAALLVVWLLLRRTVRALAALPEAVRRAATGSADQRDQIQAWVRARFMTIAFGAVVAIVIGLSAQTMVGWLREIGMSKFWATLGFVAFDGVATMLALTLWQRSRRGESTGMIRPALWTLVLIAAWLCSHKAPEGENHFAASVVYALFPIVAALALEYLLQESRRDRAWLKEQAGEKAKRRLALIRWLHPVERLLVQLEMATDEDMSAEEATARVRQRAETRRQERAIRGVRTAVWTLRRDLAAANRAGRLTRWARERHARVSEERAQRAIAAAQMATSTMVVARVLRELQMMTLADRFAGMDYSSVSEARVAMANLITEEQLALRLELEAAPAPVADRRPTTPAAPDPTPDPDPEPEPTPDPTGPRGDRPTGDDDQPTPKKVWLPVPEPIGPRHLDPTPVGKTDLPSAGDRLPFLNPENRPPAPEPEPEPGPLPVEVPRDDTALLVQVHALVMAGELPLVLTRAQRAGGQTVPDRPAAEALRDAVGCGQARSRRLRDAYPDYVAALTGAEGAA